VFSTFNIIINTPPFQKKKRNDFNRRRSPICRYSEGNGRSVDISDAMRELCVIIEEMKGLCLSVQFKAFCGVGEEGKLPS
jgi:hypothetical protein